MTDEIKNLKENPELVYKTKQNQFGLGRRTFVFLGIVAITTTVLVGLSLLGLLLLK